MACPGASVGVIVCSGDLGLFIQRARGPKSGTWAFPAGHQEAGEMTTETAIREVAEEVSVKVTADMLRNPRSYGRLDDECRHGTTHHNWITWEVEVTDLFPTRSLDETMDMKWVPQTAWASLDLEPVWRYMLISAGYIEEGASVDATRD